MKCEQPGCGVDCWSDARKSALDGAWRCPTHHIEGGHADIVIKGGPSSLHTDPTPPMGTASAMNVIDVLRARVTELEADVDAQRALAASRLRVVEACATQGPLIEALTKDNQRLRQDDAKAARVAELEAALRDAATVFRGYAEHHRAGAHRGSLAMEKAEANDEHAERIEKVLGPPAPKTHDHACSHREGCTVVGAHDDKQCEVPGISWSQGPARCLSCGHRWRAVVEEDEKVARIAGFECPSCGGMHGDWEAPEPPRAS